MTSFPRTLNASTSPWQAIAVLAAAVAVGAAVGAKPAYGVALILAAAGACAVFALGAGRTLAGIAIALFAGASLDALPGPLLTGNKGLLAMAALAAIALWAGRSRVPSVPAEVRALAALLTLCAAVAIGRSWSLGYPIGASIKFGTDFLLFGALTVGLIASFADSDLRRVAVASLGALAVWVSAVNIAASLHLVEPSGFFAHAYNATSVGSLTRIYAYSRELPTVAIPFAFAAALMASTTRVRVGSIAVVLICSTEVLLELGRAKYAGLAIAILLIAAIWGPRFRTRLVVAVLILASAFAVASRSGGLQEPVSQLRERAFSIVSSDADAENADGDTLAYRDAHKAAIRASMGTREWITGRGSLPATSFSFAPDPTRSLRNSDLGWYNALNTMGLLGVFGLYGLLLTTLRRLWLARQIPAREQWLVAGATGYLVYVLVVSPTLVSLFSAWGLTTVALAIGLGLSAAATVQSASDQIQ